VKKDEDGANLELWEELENGYRESDSAFCPSSMPFLTESCTCAVSAVISVFSGPTVAGGFDCGST
jgi:hypothetical protein